MRRTALDGLEHLRHLAASGALATLCARNGVTLLVAHGSAVRPVPGAEPADLDLAVGGAADERVDLLALNNELIDASGFERIELMDLRRAGPVARARALAPDSVVLHEAVSGLFAREQIRAITEEMETRRLRRVDLELMAAG